MVSLTVRLVQNISQTPPTHTNSDNPPPRPRNSNQQVNNQSLGSQTKYSLTKYKSSYFCCVIGIASRDQFLLSR
jgi:hypothetical protein